MASFTFRPQAAIPHHQWFLPSSRRPRLHLAIEVDTDRWVIHTACGASFDNDEGVSARLPKNAPICTQCALPRNLPAVPCIYCAHCVRAYAKLKRGKLGGNPHD